MTLDQMRPGQTLAVLLDSNSARNVPESAEKDGHSVVSVDLEGDHWRVLIRRG